MNAHVFPDDPNRRKAILVLTQHDIEKCYYEPGAARSFFDEEVFVLPFPVQIQIQLHPAMKNILDSGLANPGVVLVQSPYEPNTYEDVSQAPVRFALAKHMHFSTLCMYLGAKEVTVEQDDQKARTDVKSIKTNGNYRGIKGDATLESEELSRLRSQLSLHNEFTGGKADVVAAEKLLRSTKLWGDPNMMSLVAMRQNSNNELVSHKLTINLSSETKRCLNVVGRLSVPTFVQLSADYKSVVQKQHDFTLTVIVKF